ncbi:alpha-L-rhamnosidase C-terminal domain-containing protein [Gracilibacillus phocaeensis]|uniref:alpha-L-rhamnosidase-related protein n=1 Tax=Gracilibacillus phocaeensis TaxID=2042304 RepID=UPI001031CE25|nr:alpha-L-rhamnosidase C-terminal domain-containing protein [Gracilibacillus phocaeensis]
MLGYEYKKRKLTNLWTNELSHRLEHDNRVRTYLTPKRVIWKTEGEQADVKNPECLLEKRSGQITLDTGNACRLTNNGAKAGVLLDFGMELQGGVQILAWGGDGKTSRLRVRFGESAMEAMSELGEKNATNDHAIRDQELEVSFMGMSEIGNTGFRFVRIDLLDETNFVDLKSVRAIFIYQDIEYKGSFTCNDELLNQIWQTGAYTVHLNMQNYLWDGIKRDRLVWVGDMHPETSTIQTVFGYDDSVPRSLDLIRDETKIPGWMNGIPAYSMWWILIQKDWYMHNGDIEYLKEQKAYLLTLLSYLDEFILENGQDSIPHRFIDWPSSDNTKAVEAGVHSLFILAMEAGAELCKELNETKLSEKYMESVIILRKYVPDYNHNKQAASLMALAGITDYTTINNEILSIDGAKNISTFLGYYVLIARAHAGDIIGSLENIREYWGGMLSLGATTFWEDFDVKWLDNAAKIDEIVVDGEDKIDVHGSYGDHCYIKYRHSLCHGWASGPTAWLSEFVLGIKVVEAGCKMIEIKPGLGDLEWAEGNYPTPQGNIFVRHELKNDGTVKSYVEVPDGIQVISSSDVEIVVSNH